MEKKHILKEMHFEHFSALVVKIISSKILETLLKTTVCKVKMAIGETESF